MAALEGWAMLRWLTSGIIVATIAAAFGVTWVKHDARRIEAKLQAQERLIEKAESDIAVLRAELGFLTRPERLEPLARKHLSLQPATSGQIISIDELPRRAVLPVPPAPLHPRAGGQ
jgi:cell division protein FtsL